MFDPEIEKLTKEKLRLNRPKMGLAYIQETDEGNGL